MFQSCPALVQLLSGRLSACCCCFCCCSALRRHCMQPNHKHVHSCIRAAAAPAQMEQVTLDAAREQFYVAQRACERMAVQLGALVASLEQQKPEDGWLSTVQQEAARLATFHAQQHAHWAAMAGDIDAYVDSVRSLADQIAINDLKGLPTEEADSPENKARTVHPELVRFQLEKKARILGKVGGVPALGPGMAAVLPQLPKGGGSILKATASPAAREIYYSKLEDTDASNLAGVFQFRNKAANSDVGPVDWQQEAAAKNLRRGSEAAADELRRQEEQQLQLGAAGATEAELAGVLRVRQQALHSTEEEEAAAAASSYRRTPASAAGGGSEAASSGLQAALPELASKLRQRQEAAERAAAEEQAVAAAAGAGEAPAQGWSNAHAPFGSELSSVLAARWQTKEAADAAAPVQSALPPRPSAGAAAVNSELAAALAARRGVAAAAAGDEEDGQ